MKLYPVPERLETKRLILARAQPADARELHRAISASFRHLHPWMPWAKQRPKLADTRQFCRHATKAFQERKEFSFVMRLKTDGVPIGGCGLVRGDLSVPKFEIGYWLHSDFTGCGYATEAVEALVRFARKHLRVRRLEIRTDGRNVRSAAVALRAGFEPEAVLRNDARDNRGRLRDTRIYTKVF